MRDHTHRPVAVGLLLLLMSCGGSDDVATPADAAEPTEPPGDAAPAQDDDGSAAQVSPGEPAPAEPATDEPETSDSVSSSRFGEPGTGVIEIGGLRHELTVLRCVAMAGAMGGDAVSTSEPDNIDVSFSFSPEDWRERNASEGWTETGSVRLDSEEPYQQWESGISALEGFNLPAGLTAADLDITAIDISDDGRSARGEAMFVEINSIFTGGDAVTAPGSFEFTCPDN